MKSLIESAERPRRRGHASSRLMRASLLALLVALVGLVPTMAPAGISFKIRVLDVSASQTGAGQDYTLRANVVTTCTPIMEAAYGSCGDISITVSWWTDSTPIKVGTTRVMMVGGPLQFRVPAADVKLPTLHYRIAAAQVWTRSECLVPPNLCPRQQTASAQIYGRTQVS